MEFFSKSKAVKLRSHLGKYLVADEDHERVRQSKNGSTKKAIWLVELVELKNNRVRLRSFNGRYLTATDAPFLLGMTGDKVVQSDYDTGLGWKYEWEPIKEGFHSVKLRSWCGKYLRGNGGTPPWRNSITHDDPYTSKTNNWILWGVEPVELLHQNMVSFADSVVSSSYDSDEISGSEPVSPVLNSSIKSSDWSSFQSRQDSTLSQKMEESTSKSLTENLQGLLRVRVKRGVNLAVRDVLSSDPYVVIQMYNKKLKTRVIKNNVNPEWNEDLTISVSDPNHPVSLTVYDHDTFSKDDKMGDADFDILPFIKALRMNVTGLPNDTVIKRVQPSQHNCLADESCIYYSNGKIIQDMILRLQSVECGEVEIQLNWIDLHGSKGL